MLLKLNFKETTQHETCAAFIRGDDAEGWLREIDRWGVPSDKLKCFIVPTSVNTIYPAGLFVILPVDERKKDFFVADPYGVIAGKLYVPAHASLYPEVTPLELKRLLLYDVQMFHPVIGLIGFDLSDQLDPATLLTFPDVSESNWNLAHPGVSPDPRLKEIHVQQLTVQDVLDSFKESIETKPLNEIPEKEEDKPSAATKFIDEIKRRLLKGALSGVKKIEDIFTDKNAAGKPPVSGTPTPVGSRPASPSGPGIFNRFQQWLKENLDELEKKRNDEIQRLLKMFDEDYEEALRYAIPLDSPYMNRGAAPPSGTLARGSSLFDLSRLSGGGPADYWHVDHYYHDLRAKYQKTAQKEIEAGDFKKAAYIYAHLLGDFHSAANVLEQGKHYREAAVLHKEHLKNIPAAAECLERGGLILEAIELFAELKKHEKVGDLYKQIDQHEKANEFYEKSSSIALANEDYLDAARIFENKMEEGDRAKQTLLKGWVGTRQSEPCLKQYFDSLLNKERDKMSDHVQHIFQHHTPAWKRSAFLNVLQHINKKSGQPELLDTSRNIAYQIISDEAIKGETSNIYVLKDFLQDDRLISSDCSRFVNQQRINPVKASSDEGPELDKSITWVKAVSHRNQFIALGLKNSKPQLARGNWYGHLEYYSWSESIRGNNLSLIANPYASNYIIIHTPVGLALEEKKLSKNKHFEEELLVNCPTWLSQGFFGIALKSDGDIAALKNNNYLITIHTYSRNLELKHSLDCKLEGEHSFVMSTTGSLSQVICRNKSYFTSIGNLFLKISEEGLIQSFETESAIKMLAASPEHMPLRIIAVTDHGCVLIHNEEVAIDHSDILYTSESDIVDVLFISSDQFVAACRDKLILYKIDGITINKKKSYETPKPTKSILMTSDRGKFAVLDQSDKISFYNI